jgi:hypothetical protein
MTISFRKTSAPRISTVIDDPESGIVPGTPLGQTGTATSNRPVSRGPSCSQVSLSLPIVKLTNILNGSEIVQRRVDEKEASRGVGKSDVFMTSTVLELE